MNPRPSESIAPHSGVGGCAPKPRNDRDAPTMIAVATPRVDTTTSGARMFGKMWRDMIWRCPTPITREASTNSRWRVASVDARTRRT